MNRRAIKQTKGEKGVAQNFPLATTTTRRSQLVNQITATNAEGFRNSQQRIHRNGSMPVFQQGNKNDRQSRFLGERLLCQSRLFAAVADGFAQRAPVFWNRRHAPYKQERSENNIYYSINLILRTCGKQRKNASATLRAKGFMKDKVRILVVDDQMPVALMMVFLLTRAGCDADAAMNAEKALRLAQADEFDLITIDIGMPDLDGFSLFQKLRLIPHLKETPVVFVSGNSTIENQQRALDLGAEDFIEKPFDTQDFISRILSLVETTATA